MRFSRSLKERKRISRRVGSNHASQCALILTGQGSNISYFNLSLLGDRLMGIRPKCLPFSYNRKIMRSWSEKAQIILTVLPIFLWEVRRLQDFSISLLGRSKKRQTIIIASGTVYAPSDVGELTAPTGAEIATRIAAGMGHWRTLHFLEISHRGSLKGW